MEEAISGDVGTEAAALRLNVPPAMLLIDVDGSLPPAPLGPKGAKVAAQTIRRMGLSGSIGIDLPTMNNKDERMIAAAQIDKYLPAPLSAHLAVFKSVSSVQLVPFQDSVNA